MSITNKSILILLLLLVYTLQTRAQVFDEWAARPNISLKYKFNKDWAIAGTYYHYLEDNMSHYDKSVISIDIGYKINSWLKAGIDYRFGINSKEHYHDIRYSVTFDYEPSAKWKLEYRPMLQQEFTSLKKEKLATEPVKYYWRNRLTVSYDITGNLELYVFTENYLKPDKGDLFFFRQKSALGADFDINERNKIGTRFEIINKKNGKNIARPNLSYTYTFGYLKKKK